MVANNTTAHRNVDEDINSNNGEVEEEEESQLLFSCQCDSARTVADLLSCLRRVVTSNVSSSTWSEGVGASGGGGGGNIGGSTQRTAHTQSTAAAVAVAGGTANKIQHATVYAGPNGLTFHVQHGLARQSQCSVDLPKGLFREYFVGEEEVWLEDSDVESTTDNMTSSSSQQGGRTKEIIHGGEFSVNLTTVLECFSVLSRNNKSVQSMTKGSNHNGSGSSSGRNKQSLNSEYAALDRVPLCMSYDRATATFHLEFLEGGHIGGSGDARNMGGGCLVTCEVPGVAVSDDVDDGPDDDDEMDNHNSLSSNNTSGLAAAFRSSPLISRAILYSDALQAAVAELYDVPGASIVQVTLSNEGMELGTVGPRSEVWVNVPYHKRQTGMYVGMECYKTNNDPFGTQSASPTLIRKYPLGAFLTGMRGLDIGCETCISVNSRGMMAIQHQVAKDGYTDTSTANVRPSFVDFIMTCIEDNDDDDEGLSQENISQGVQNDAWQNEEMAEEPKARRTHNNIARSRTRETFSSEEDEEMHSRTTRRRKEKRRYDSASGSDDDEGYDRRSSSSNNAASKILGELELDNDMLSSSHRGGAAQGRKNALDDIRRRRRERQNESSMPAEESDTGDGGDMLPYEDDDTAERRDALRNKRSSRKMRRSEGNSGDTNQSDDNNPRLHSLRSTVQSSSDDNDDEDGDESEPEDALDVTAEISFSKTPSKSTSRNGRRRGRSMDVDDDEAVEEEPKMMYGDTRLEFTQDGYESGDS